MANQGLPATPLEYAPAPDRRAGRWWRVAFWASVVHLTVVTAAGAWYVRVFGPDLLWLCGRLRQLGHPVDRVLGFLVASPALHLLLAAACPLVVIGFHRAARGRRAAPWLGTFAALQSLALFMQGAALAWVAGRGPLQVAGTPATLVVTVDAPEVARCLALDAILLLPLLALIGAAALSRRARGGQGE